MQQILQIAYHYSNLNKNDLVHIVGARRNGVIHKGRQYNTPVAKPPWGVYKKRRRSYLKRISTCYAIRHLERISGSLYVTSRFIPQDAALFCTHTHTQTHIYCVVVVVVIVASGQRGFPIAFMSRLLLGPWRSTRHFLPVPTSVADDYDSQALPPALLYDKWYPTFSFHVNKISLKFLTGHFFSVIFSFLTYFVIYFSFVSLRKIVFSSVVTFFLFISKKMKSNAFKIAEMRRNCIAQLRNIFRQRNQNLQKLVY